MHGRSLCPIKRNTRFDRSKKNRWSAPWRRTTNPVNKNTNQPVVPLKIVTSSPASSTWIMLWIYLAGKDNLIRHYRSKHTPLLKTTTAKMMLSSIFVGDRLSLGGLPLKDSAQTAVSQHHFGRTSPASETTPTKRFLNQRNLNISKSRTTSTKVSTYATRRSWLHTCVHFPILLAHFLFSFKLIICCCSEQHYLIARNSWFRLVNNKLLPSDCSFRIRRLFERLKRF